VDTEYLRASLKTQWLDYYRSNRTWINRLSIWVTCEGERRPSSSFILATLAILEPNLNTLLPLIVDLSSNPDRIILALGLNFNPDQALQSRHSTESTVKMLPSGNGNGVVLPPMTPREATTMPNVASPAASQAVTSQPITSQPIASPSVASPSIASQPVASATPIAQAVATREVPFQEIPLTSKKQKEKGKKHRKQEASAPAVEKLPRVEPTQGNSLVSAIAPSPTPATPFANCDPLTPYSDSDPGRDRDTDRTTDRTSDRTSDSDYHDDFYPKHRRYQRRD
jgi:hypothetical protein